MAKAASNPEVLKTLTHYIWSCTSSPRKWSDGKYKEIYHFESKAAITGWIRDNEPELAKRMGTVQVAFCASNKSDGTYTIDRLTPPHKKHPFIVTRWDAGPFVKALLEREPGKNLLAYTSMISFSQMAGMWTRATGEKASYRQCTLKELQGEFPDEGEEGNMSDMYSSDFGYHGGDPDCLMLTDVGIEDRPDVVERWLMQADWVAVMGPGWRGS